MSENAVFLVTEAWAIPGTFDQFMNYRKAVTDAFAKYQPEYVTYNHAFEWFEGDDGDEMPTGMEVVRFDSLEQARQALADISTPDMKRMEKEVFSKVRSYLARLAPPEWLMQEMQDSRSKG